MKPNISVMNAIMRITCGLTVLAWATSRLSRRRSCISYIFVALLGAMKVAEGIHRYCPVTDILKQNVSIKVKGHEGKEKHDEHEGKEKHGGEEKEKHESEKDK